MRQSKYRQAKCSNCSLFFPDTRRRRTAFVFLKLLSTARSLVEWTGGPEDTFFCGFKWDDEDCPNRQHCPSGRNEDCELFSEGQKCFAITNCDAKKGDGNGFILSSESSPKESPAGSPGTARPTFTGVSDDPTDHYWCGIGLDDAMNNCVQHCPTGQSGGCPQGHICYHEVTSCDARNLPPETNAPLPNESLTPSGSIIPGSTKIPTDMPIPPPEPLPFPSDDLTDHWFCGLTLDEANANCAVHCPTAKECPLGQICFFGTNCDGRTYSPTPPPTRRPTKPPTNSPKQIPTKTPTSSPSKRPTWAPMPSLQASFFCGLDWNDAIENCKKRCPAGEDTDCPTGEFCFTGTPCTEEMGYPDDNTGSGSNDTSIQECIPFEVTIVADAWPKETSWQVNDTITGELVVEGGNDELVSGEARLFRECINDRKGCYVFTILDSGGDGICCDCGEGKYTVEYDGAVVKKGAAFYDSESTEFGLCGATELPTMTPAKSLSEEAVPSSQESENSTNSAYRCLDDALAGVGYEISKEKCDLFENCFNPQIKIGDDWFCDEGSSCIEAIACGDTGKSVNETTSTSSLDSKNETSSLTTTPTPTPTPNSASDASISPTKKSDNETTSALVASAIDSKNGTSILKPIPKPNSKTNVSDPMGQSPSSPPKTISDKRPAAPKPKPIPVASVTTTIVPTLIPVTYSPTLGACGGEKCSEADHCRSQYGFCGPGKTYCNEKATWTADCPTSGPNSTDLTTGPNSTSLANSSDSSNISSFFDDAISPSMSPSVLENHSGAPSSNTSTLPLKKSTAPTIESFINDTVSPSTSPSLHELPWIKPGRGKGPITKPKRSHPPTTSYPIITVTLNPTDSPTVLSSIAPSIAHSDAPLSLSPITRAPTATPSFFSKFMTDDPSGSAVNSYSPSESMTLLPSSSISTQPSIVPTQDTTEKLTSEYACTGERCPVDTHCRSRYGSCGPGFIYCNLYSTWESSCPPPIPGVSPTKAPSLKPTTGSISPIKVDKPTLPPIPKPTLPTIVEMRPATLQGGLEQGVTETDKLHNDGATNETKPQIGMEQGSVVSDKIEKLQNDNESNQSNVSKEPESTFASAQYLDIWAKTHSSGNIRYNRFNAGYCTIIAIVTLHCCI